jgi:6-pyruvoyltetrahydropterin/6-carboxytetrahydropterin synthase
MFELSQSFYFEAAHTLERLYETESSRRIHGHTYMAEIAVQGEPDARGMVMDLAQLRAAIQQVRDQLDHHFLDEVPGIGRPTLENLCVYIHDQVRQHLGHVTISAVSVFRQASGDRCVYRPRVEREGT